MSTDVLGQSILWFPSLSIVELPACKVCMWRGTESDSHRLSPCGHSRGWRPFSHASLASAFLHPFAPQALPRFFATMGALTPTRLTQGQPFTGQVSLLNTVQPSLHSVTKHLVRPVVASKLPAQRDGLPDDRSDGFALPVIGSGLRHESAGSSQHTAETCFSSYGLQVRFRLLPTPPRGDAVTFGYRERASPGRGLAPLRLRLLAGARIPVFTGMTTKHLSDPESTRQRSRKA